MPTLSHCGALLLAHLYECFFTKDAKLLPSAVLSHIDLVSLEKELADLSNHGLIECRSHTGAYNLTDNGATLVERLRLPEAVSVVKNIDLQRRLLLHLGNDYDRNGPHRTHGSLPELVTALASCEDAMFAHLAFLHRRGSVEFHHPFVTLTPDGWTTVRTIRAAQKLHSTFDALSALPPHPRGLEFNAFMERIFTMGGWTTKASVRSPGEENDVVVSKEREVYLVECKWESSPVEAGAIRNFGGKLTNRYDRRGLFVSMSGFTTGAISEAESPKHALLLFGKEDVAGLVCDPSSFSDVLTKKYWSLVSYKKAIWE